MLRRLRSFKQSFLTAPPPPDPPGLPTLVIDNISIPFGTVAQDYAAIQFTATGNVGAVDWELQSGSTNGITLNQNGLFGGPGQQPVNAEEVIFIVKATTVAGQSATRSFTMASETMVAMLTETVPGGTSGSAYSHFFTAAGGKPPYTYSVSSGIRPAGSNLNPLTGELASASLGLSGPYDFEVQALDSRGRRAVLSVHIDIAPNFAISNTSIPNATVGQTNYTAQLTVSGIISSHKFVAITVPQWMFVDLITGIVSSSTVTAPTGTVSATFAVVEDGTGFYDLATLTVQVIEAGTTLEITTAALASATVGTAYTGQSIIGTGGSGTKVYTLPTKPAWLSQSSSTGALTGTPTTGSHGSPTVVARITDDSGFVERTFTLVVAPAAMIFVTTSLSDGTIGVAYSQGVTITGGVSPYNLSLVSGTLPSGLSLSGVLVQGTPTTVQNPNFVLRATDSLGVGVNSGTLSINIAAAVILTDEQADFVRRSGLGRVRMATNFATDAEVHDYMFHNSTYQSDPTLAQWVDENHADEIIRIPGYTGCMKFRIPASIGEGGMNWVRKLNDAHTGILDGYGPGETVWAHFRIRVPSELAENRNSHTTGSGGWKILILDNWFKSSTEHEIVINNQSYRNYIMGYHKNNSGFQPWERFLGTPNDVVFQPAILHTSIATQPAGKDPTVGGSLGLRRSYGGIYGFVNVNPGQLPVPGSDTGESGGIMWSRDCANDWINVQIRVKIGTWGQPNTELEVWVALEGDDYKYKLYEFNNLTLGIDTTNYTVGNVNDAYPYVGDVDPASNPQGTHKISAAWLTFFNTARIPNTGSPLNTELAGYWGEVIVRDGDAGNPAPGFLAPPVSKYGIPSFVPTTLGQVVRLDSAANSRPRLIDCILPAQLGSSGSNDGRDLMNPWCSFFWDYATRFCYQGGDGGHASAFNSQVAVYDPNGITQPTGWTHIDGPTGLNSVSATASMLYGADSGDSKVRWSATHTYNGKLRVPDGRLFILGGSGTLGSGADVIGLRSFNPVTEVYTSHGLGPFTTDSEHASFICWDPAYPDVILCVRLGIGKWGVFNLITNNWGATGNTSTVSSSGAAAAGGFYDPRRHRLVVFGSLTSALRIVTFNGISASSSISWTGTGATDGFVNAFGPGTVYDEELDVAWVLDVSAPNPQYPVPADRATKIARLDLDLTASNQLSFTSYSLVGTRITNTHGGSQYNQLKRGTYCSIGVMKGWNSILAHNRVDEAPYLIRKPV